MENELFSELNDLFMEVKDAEPEYQDLSDGEYLAKVTVAEYTMSKSDKPMVHFAYEVTEGELVGKKTNKFMMLCGKDETQLKANLNRYGTELKKYGIIATSIQDSFDQLKTIIGKDVKLTIKTTESGFVNKSIEVLE